MNFNILTLFPDAFPGVLGQSVTGRALAKNLWNYQAINIRDFAKNKHKTVDDKPYGGGSGMLIKPDVIADAIENIPSNKRGRLIYTSASGKLFNQDIARNLAEEENLTFLCGRYEGVDNRVIEYYNMQELSIGKYVLSGGELATQVMIDAIIRNLDGVLGNNKATEFESYGDDDAFQKLLEFPQYTRPEIWRGQSVPDILLSGNHAKIRQWQLQQAKAKTSKIN